MHLNDNLFCNAECPRINKKYYFNILINKKFFFSRQLLWSYIRPIHQFNHRKHIYSAVYYVNNLVYSTDSIQSYRTNDYKKQFLKDGNILKMTSKLHINLETLNWKKMYVYYLFLIFNVFLSTKMLEINEKNHKKILNRYLS